MGGWRWLHFKVQGWACGQTMQESDLIADIHPATLRKYRALQAVKAGGLVPRAEHIIRQARWNTSRANWIDNNITTLSLLLQTNGNRALPSALNRRSDPSMFVYRANRAHFKSSFITATRHRPDSFPYLCAPRCSCCCSRGQVEEVPNALCQCGGISLSHNIGESRGPHRVLKGGCFRKKRYQRECPMQTCYDACKITESVRATRVG